MLLQGALELFTANCVSSAILTSMLLRFSPVCSKLPLP